MIDFSTGLALSVAVDPVSGGRSAIYGKLFNLTGLAIFVVSGGLRLFVRGLMRSKELVALDGGLAMDGRLRDVLTDLMSQMFLAAAELALPVLSSLILAELVIGLGGRFAPQMNVFLLGLPAKLLAAMLLVSTVMVLFPRTMETLLGTVEETFGAVLAGFGG